MLICSNSQTGVRRLDPKILFDTTDGPRKTPQTPQSCKYELIVHVLQTPCGVWLHQSQPQGFSAPPSTHWSTQSRLSWGSWTAFSWMTHRWRHEHFHVNRTSKPGRKSVSLLWKTLSGRILQQFQAGFQRATR